MTHFHHCAECFTHVICDMSCDIEPDLQDGDKEFGHNIVCSSCENPAPKTKPSLKLHNDEQVYNHEFFYHYNGFSNRRKNR